MSNKYKYDNDRSYKSSDQEYDDEDPRYFDGYDIAEIFGKPRTGLHKYRIPILDIAFVDVLLTFLVAYILYLAGIGYGTIGNFIILFIIAEVLHAMFGVNTKVIEFIKSTKVITYNAKDYKCVATCVKN
jgi:hypothetical protein